MTSLKGKVAVVTGASRGVGKGVALELAACGATVYALGRTESGGGLPEFFKDTTIHKTAEEMNALGGVGIAHRCDLRDDREVEELFDRVIREQGRLDILVNCAWAGAEHVMNGYFWNTPFWEQPMSLFDDFFAVGLRSNYLTSRYAAGIMAKQKDGLIVNISFYSARQYWITPAHGIFKAATDKMTADTAFELKPYGVKVFSLYPGSVGTEGMKELSKYDPSMRVQEMETPQFVGRCVAHLFSDGGAMEQTGSVLLTAEVAQKYGFKDIDGKSPVSLRSQFSM